MKANEIIKARRTDLGMTQKELAGVEPAQCRRVYVRIGVSCQDTCQGMEECTYIITRFETVIFSFDRINVHYGII